jgi:hypothetical protein
MKKQTENCVRCGKDITDLKSHIEKRYCNAQDKNGKFGFALFCIKCEPYQEMGDHH